MIAENSAGTPAPPIDLRAEGARVRSLSGRMEGVKALTEGIRLINDTVLVQVLFGLWDSGFYEYSLRNPTFALADAAEAMEVDPTILQWLADYLVGRGILRAEEGRFGLTESGSRLSNVLFRGTMDLYVGGWGPQLANIGPLLRKEVTQDQFRGLRSGKHTVRGTEQLICIRTVPAILKALASRKLRNVVHLACRNGEFLIDLARAEPDLRGIGVDKAPERIAASRANALRHGVDARLRFEAAEVGRDPLPTGEVDAVVALYLLHEVYRHGRARVVAMLRTIREAYPGRTFLFMETLPAEPPAPGKKPPETFSQLDYLLIHRLRDQGLPLPAAEWRSILEESGVAIQEVQEIYWSALYVAEL